MVQQVMQPSEVNDMFEPIETASRMCLIEKSALVFLKIEFLLVEVHLMYFPS